MVEAPGGPSLAIFDIRVNDSTVLYLFNDRFCAISRTIINDHNFKVGKLLLLKLSDRTFYEGCPVVGGDDNREKGGMIHLIQFGQHIVLK